MARRSHQNITLTARCLCKSSTFSAQLPRNKVPLEASMCHCTSCRNVTGAMYSSDTDWPGPIEEVLNSELKRYEFTSNVRILFCGTCSTPLFWHQHYQNKPQSIGVFTGALKDVRVKNLVKFVDQIFVGDTQDGGISPWLWNVNQDGSRLRLWKGNRDMSEELSDNWPTSAGGPVPGAVSRDSIPIRCRCKGVQFMFRPSNVDFSDTAQNTIPFYVDPKSHKHLATLDPCSYCRLSVGVDVMNWTFALPAQIEFAQDSKEGSFPRNTHELKDAVQSPNRDPRYGTLAMYRSSSDVQRYFCSRCSALVFYTVDDRPDVIDVAVGLLQAPEGARAESVLVWHLGAKTMGDEEHGDSWRDTFARSVNETSERWRIEKGHPKTWARLAAEDAKNE
ncbi:Mss4-like protein [Fusarium venenatum]|uniref:Mss4-like protein n=1 Tax=Fusarium venenatum TaxID=56646 RepID=UPI001E04565C|nr:Mss4-like protein [Fusarium venenatum]